MKSLEKQTVKERFSNSFNLKVKSIYHQFDQKNLEYMSGVLSGKNEGTIFIMMYLVY